MNGQRQQVNNFTVDGIDSNEAINNGISYQPSPDAVEQVSVESNNYSAELGNVAGAIVNMVIKSGTNRYSGNGFYYWRDNELAATPWATNRAGGAKASSRVTSSAAQLAGRCCATRCSSSGTTRADARTRLPRTPSRPSCPMSGGEAISAACSRGASSSATR